LCTGGFVEDEGRKEGKTEDEGRNEGRKNGR
jgi:hypothetical protein